MRGYFYRIQGITLFVLLSLFLIGFAQKKPVHNRNLELLPDEKEEFYYMENMRVNKHTGVPIALYQINYQATPDAPEAMAEQYLRDNARLLHLKADLSDLRHTVTRETPGGYHVRYQQYAGNYPVYKADLVVNINRQNQVNFVMNSYKPGVQLKKNLTPSVSPSRAKEIALNYLGVRGRINYQKVQTVVYYHKGITRLAQKVNIVPAEDVFGDWEIMIDATTGEIFRVADIALYYSGDHRAGGSGWVFDPDPLTTSGATYGDPGFSDNGDGDTDSLTAQIVPVNLPDLTYSNGNYHLEGPYANIEDFEGPFNGQFSQPDSVFHYTRNPDAFEAVNVYYHVDKSMRYINETLGFNLMPFQYSGGVQGDPHGLNGADNSHYIPSTGQVAWGEGGVDDAEDSDVILHELGHGIHDWLTNGSLSQEEGLSEGCGDYWAASYNRSFGLWQPSDPQYYWVFQWDGHNEFWPGRVTNWPNLYPSGLVGQIHTDGQIWASTLMQVWDAIGRIPTDENFLEALSMTNSSSNQQDAAQAFIQADINLHGGAYLSVIGPIFEARGYMVTIPAPTINHTPLTDTEDINGPYLVTADITSGVPLENVWLIYGNDGVFSDTLTMNPTRSGYSAQITGLGVPASYNYYIFASDTSGLASTHPGGAPANYHQFYAGPDTVPPIIIHTPLRDQPYIRWPATVQANVTDNLGIASVVVNYYVNSPSNPGSFTLTDQGNGNYSGTFDIDTTAISIGDSIFYRITATDASQSGNITNDPTSGFHAFRIIDTRGLVLIIDDDPGTSTTIHDEKGTYTRRKDSFGASANRMQRWLNQLGYVADVVDVTTALTTNWEDYSIVINSSGANTSPVENAAYRAKWESYVTDPSHKYIIEGGEVGYDAASSPGYPNFATMVIHSDDWDADNAGALNLRSGYSNHPLATYPNPLPTTIAINYQGWGDQDSQKNLPDAYVVYGTANQPDNAGILIYDDNTNPVSAQMAYYAFNLSALTDTVVARNLLENTLEFLLANEAPPTGAISGNVDLTNTVNDSGVFVLLTGPKTDSTVTNVNGDFFFGGLFPGTYAVTVSKEGYYPYASTIHNIVVNNDTVPNINFTLDPIQMATITGTVTLSDTNVYDGVVVEVLNQPGRMDTTDASGNYTIPDVLPGAITVKAYKLGYRSVKVDTTVPNNGSTLTINFQLIPGVNEFYFDFEADNGNFVGSPSWEWGTPASGPGSAYQGSKLWATNLSGSYSSNEHAELTTLPLDLGAFIHPKLTFAHWYDIEESSTPNIAWDGGNVKISTDGGATFTLIRPVGDYPDSISVNTTSNALAGQPVYSGTSGGWLLAEFDLSAFAGETVILKFDFGSDGSVTYDGWYIDSVSVVDEATAPTPPANLTVLDNVGKVVLGWDAVFNKLLSDVSRFEKETRLSRFLQTLQKEAGNPPQNPTGGVGTRTVSYKIYRSETGTAFSTVGASSVNSYTDTLVTVGNTYYYYVTAVMGNIESDPSDTVSTVVQIPTTTELIYDDGTPTSGYYWNSAGTGSGNRMSPSGLVQILKAKFYLLQPSAGSNTFVAKIFDYDGTQPTTELGAVQVNNAPSDTWVEVDFSGLNITIDHDFIVFMEYDGTNKPVFGFDPVNNGRAWDYDPGAGGWSAWNETYFMRAVVSTASGIKSELGAVPDRFDLAQNFPNPFNPETIIKYQLPRQSHVKLEIYNTLGQKVRTLVDATQKASYYSVKWDGRNQSGNRVSSGIYLYRLETDGFVRTRKMILLR